MYDQFERKINYLRISVTDRCNLRCEYCMPEEGVPLLNHKEILTYDEIVAVTKSLVAKGVSKIRITGGEPLVRKNIVELVRMLANIDGIKDFGMTTNGILLEKYAQQLKAAGLHRVNISLDTINPEEFHRITRLGDIHQVFRGIEAAKAVQLHPIKINCVIKESEKKPNAQEVAEFCKQNDLEVRFIREMNLKTGDFWQVKGGDGGNCSICNRLRLTANGKLKPCLFSNLEYDVRELGIETAIAMALKSKPLNGSANSQNSFNNIGG